MKQIIQNYSTGVLELAEGPVPIEKPGHVLIVNACSVISVGAEREGIDSGQNSSYILV
jgi:hypothetical protein